MKCPNCGRPVEENDEANRSLPFCSERCQWVDLGRWLSEDYRVVDPPEEEGVEDPER